MSINIQKTEILTVTKENKDIVEIEIENEYVKEAECVKYLGSVFARDGYKNKEEITERISQVQ